MKIVRAAWICPITAPPIRDGWIAIDQGRIVSSGADLRQAPVGPVRDLGRVAILPGLVNAHTHLELSWLRGRVPPAATFIDWIKQLFVTRGGRRERPDDPKVVEPAQTGDSRPSRDGRLARVGDISNSLATVEPLKAAGMRGVVFHELLGFNVPARAPVDETRPVARGGARTPAETTCTCRSRRMPVIRSRPEMFRAIRDELERAGRSGSRASISASRESEMVFLRRRQRVGWPGLLRWWDRGSKVGSRRGAGRSSFSSTLRFLDARTLVVHGVQLSDASLSRVAALGARSSHARAVISGLVSACRPLSASMRRGRAGGGWHRQSRQRRRSQSVFGARRRCAGSHRRIPARTLLESATLSARARSGSTIGWDR